MFAKLLKHELKAQGGLFGILSLAALGAGILGCLMSWLLVYNADNSSGNGGALGAAFGGLMLMGVMLALIAYSLAVWILLLYRFYKHHFTHEGYLTFTLPATTHQILLSSIVNILIWVTVSGIVLLLSVGISFTPIFIKTAEELETALPVIKASFLEVMSVYPAGSEFLFILSMIASGAYSLILPLLSIVIGSLAAKKHKVLASFGIYYGISMGISMLTGMLSMVVSIADLAIGGDGLITFSLLMPAVIELCIAIGGYCLMHRLVDKKLNLP